MSYMDPSRCNLIDDSFRGRGKFEEIKKEKGGSWCSKMSDQGDLLLEPRASVLLDM